MGAGTPGRTSRWWGIEGDTPSIPPLARFLAKKYSRHNKQELHMYKGMYRDALL